MKYYLVKCKFGHVGRDKYLPLNIPVIANSLKEASRKAKTFRGVKKDHKDWCLEGPIEISYEEFIYENMIFYNDNYFENKIRSRVNDLKTNTKKYRKARDIETIKFKLKKRNIITKSFKEEQLVYEYN